MIGTLGRVTIRTLTFRLFFRYLKLLMILKYILFSQRLLKEDAELDSGSSIILSSLWHNLCENF